MLQRCVLANASLRKAYGEGSLWLDCDPHSKRLQYAVGLLREGLHLQFIELPAKRRNLRDDEVRGFVSRSSRSLSSALAAA